MRHTGLAAGLAIGLSGCGFGNYVSSYMAGESNNAPPAPLVEFAPLVGIKQGWSEHFGKGADEQFLKLEPVLLNDRVYVAERRGSVAAFSAADGKRLWQAETETAIAGGPGVGEGLVLVGTSGGEVLALSETDGKLLWRVRVPSELLAAPQAAQGVVVIHSGDGNLTALSVADGKKLWSYDRGAPALTLRGTSPPLMVKDRVIVGFDNGSLAALDLKTGQVEWEAIIAVARGRSDLERMVDIDTQPVLRDDMLYVASFQGQVAAVALDGGQILWKRDVSSYAGLGVDDKNVYVTASDGTIWALDRETGAAVWKQEKLKARSSTAPAAMGSYVVVGDVEGYLHWLRREDGQFAARVQVDKTRLIAPPVAIGTQLLVYSSGGTLASYLLQ
jgi:outer membrane protein assembly factor BamB